MHTALHTLQAADEHRPGIYGIEESDVYRPGTLVVADNAAMAASLARLEWYTKERLVLDSGRPATIPDLIDYDFHFAGESANPWDYVNQLRAMPIACDLGLIAPPATYWPHLILKELEYLDRLRVLTNYYDTHIPGGAAMADYYSASLLN